MIEPDIQRLIEEAAGIIAEEYKAKFQALTEANEQAVLELEAARRLLLSGEGKSEILARPKSHNHSPEHPRPVIGLDYNGTLTPSRTYPLDDAVPFLKCADWLQRWKARGACIHLTTAGLYYGTPDDLEVYMARRTMLEAWAYQWGVPIDIFLPKFPSDLYYDDRMVEVPPETEKVDWDIIGEKVETLLNKRFDLVNGQWVRKAKVRTGDKIENDEWPGPNSVPGDKPRGISGPRLDVDMHRTLSSASSSMRIGPPKPGAVDAMNAFYNKGVTLRLSCAGWNPKTHNRFETQRRLSGMRLWVRENKIPYDRFVTKDHCDAYVDDKGFTHTDWKVDFPKIMKRLLQESDKPLADMKPNIPQSGYRHDN